MTDRSKLLALAEAVEALSEPSIAIDIEIARTVYADNCRNPDWEYGPVLAYTASLDAAMTLLDDEWGYEQRRPSDGCKSGCFVQIWWVPAFGEKQHGIGATPALALCAAALRAQAEALA